MGPFINICDIFYFKKLIVNVGKPKVQALVALFLGWFCLHHLLSSFCTKNSIVQNKGAHTRTKELTYITPAVCIIVLV